MLLVELDRESLTMTRQAVFDGGEAFEHETAVGTGKGCLGFRGFRAPLGRRNRDFNRAERLAIHHIDGSSADTKTRTVR